MGTGIDQETFTEEEYVRFQQQLSHCLTMLGRLLARPDFGVGPVTLGAELELFLVDPAGRPLPLNQAVRAATGDRRVTLELDRFNLELNATPTPLAGHSRRWGRSWACSWTGSPLRPRSMVGGWRWSASCPPSAAPTCTPGR